MPLSRALELAKAQIAVMVGTERVPLAAARRRVLAESLIAASDLPRYDSAAMDGYALRDSDLSGAGPSTFRIIGRAAAGHPFAGAVAAGQAVRVLTGAPIPSGADTVVMQEDCAQDGDTVRLPAGRPRGNHCRRRGEDVLAGSAILPAGHRLGTADIGMAAALGYHELQVFRRVRVALFSTGDEVKEPGCALAAGQIWDANRWLLRGFLDALGCEVSDLGIVPDDPHTIEGRMAEAAGDHDLLLTSGGMSVGSEDHLRRVIGRRGTLDIWNLAIKPGKPVGLGDIDACPILALPGNPVAAAATFIAFGRPIVEWLAGSRDTQALTFRLPAGFEYRKKTGRREYLLSVLDTSEGCSKALLLPKQGAAMLSALSEAQGFVVLEEDLDSVEPGDLVEFLTLEPLFS